MWKNEKECEELSIQLANALIRCIPRVHQKTAGIHLHVDELQQLKDVMKELKEKAEQDTQKSHEIIAQKQRENEQLMNHPKSMEELKIQLLQMAARKAMNLCPIL
jgi:hypothetical protein